MPFQTASFDRSTHIILPEFKVMTKSTLKNRREKHSTLKLVVSSALVTENAKESREA